MNENDNAIEELRVITKEHFNRNLNEKQLRLLLRLYLIAPGDWRDKGVMMHEYIETAIEGLDANASRHPSLAAWGNGGRQYENTPR